MVVRTVALLVTNLCIAHPRFHPFDKLRRVVLEKVEIHGQGNAEQQFAIQCGFAEHLVKMVARAANLACQPACAALVGFELLTDKLPDVDVAVVFHCLLVAWLWLLPQWQ